MDPTSWSHPFVPILHAPLADAAVVSSSSSSPSVHSFQGMIPVSASGSDEWVEYGDFASQTRLNLEFQRRRSNAFDPFLEQASSPAEASPLPVGADNLCTPPPYRPLDGMGPPCADSNATLPAAIATGVAEWSSTASGGSSLAILVEPRKSCGSVLALHNATNFSLPDVQLQIPLSSGRKSTDKQEESPSPTKLQKYLPEAPTESEELGANGLLKKPRIATEPPAASQYPKIQMTQSQPQRSKERVGERITALQQLVSPYGKTDTASVLSEAIGYIKFLQDQVQVLSSPYIKPTLNRQDSSKAATSNIDHEEGSDLRSRGLCLVPVSCTLNVASSNGADYWASGVSGGR